MNARRVKLHELYREVEALGGSTECAEDKAYNQAICDVLQTLRASGFGDGYYIDQREHENRERRGRAVQLEAAE